MKTVKHHRHIHEPVMKFVLTKIIPNIYDENTGLSKNIKIDLSGYNRWTRTDIKNLINIIMRYTPLSVEETSKKLYFYHSWLHSIEIHFQWVLDEYCEKG